MYLMMSLKRRMKDLSLELYLLLRAVIFICSFLACLHCSNINDQLNDTSWILTNYKDSSRQSKGLNFLSSQSISIKDLLIQGHDGCNSFSVDGYFYSDNTLSVGFAMTKTTASCSFESDQFNDIQFTDMLYQSRSYSHEDTSLILYGTNGEIYEFLKQ